MEKVYTIKEGHEIIEFIRNEIQNSWKDHDKIGISHLSIDSRALCGSDIYGLQFNGNNWDVLTINVGYFGKPKVENPPTNLIKSTEGYKYYEYSCNASIKLKTFLEKNPQWSSIDQWADVVHHKKGKFKYSGHNTDNRRVSVRLGDISYDISFPENEPNDRNLLTWVKPLEESLTTMHYRNIALDKAFNIKRGRSAWLDGVWFYYDYFDGKVEIYNASSSPNDWGYYKSITKLFDPKPDTMEKIANVIRTGDLEVSEVKFVDYRNVSSHRTLKYEEVACVS